MKTFNEYLEALSNYPERKDLYDKWAVTIVPNINFDKIKKDIISKLNKFNVKDIQVEHSIEEEGNDHIYIISFKAHYKSIMQIQSAITPLFGKYHCGIAIESYFKNRSNNSIMNLFDFEKENDE